MVCKTALSQNRLTDSRGKGDHQIQVLIQKWNDFKSKLPGGCPELLKFNVEDHWPTGSWQNTAQSESIKKTVVTLVSKLDTTTYAKSVGRLEANLKKTDGTYVSAETIYVPGDEFKNVDGKFVHTKNVLIPKLVSNCEKFRQSLESFCGHILKNPPVLDLEEFRKKVSKNILSIGMVNPNDRSHRIPMVHPPETGPEIIFDPHVTKTVNNFFTTLRDNPMKLSTLPFPILYAVVRGQKLQHAGLIIIDVTGNKLYTLGFGVGGDSDKEYLPQPGEIWSPDPLFRLRDFSLAYDIVDMGILTPVHIRRINDHLATVTAVNQEFGKLGGFWKLSVNVSYSLLSNVYPHLSIIHKNFLNCASFIVSIFPESLSCSGIKYLYLLADPFKCTRKQGNFTASDWKNIYLALTNSDVDLILATTSPALASDIEELRQASASYQSVPDQWNAKRTFSEKYNLDPPPRPAAGDTEMGCLCEEDGEQGYNLFLRKWWCSIQDPHGYCVNGSSSRCMDYDWYEDQCHGGYWDYRHKLPGL